ncbi:MAG: hypothetical protein MZU97_20400 [Bacillus subtilis]|nr:hypothetical protein [Bacillus subtilis]
MKDLLEVLMVVCFGVSWPISIAKSIKTWSTKGKSLLFLCLILTGYAFGIASKIAGGTITYVFIFYCLNFTMVATDIFVYFRNRQIEFNLVRG